MMHDWNDSPQFIAARVGEQRGGSESWTQFIAAQGLVTNTGGPKSISVNGQMPGVRGN